MPFVAKEKTAKEATDVSFFGSVDLNQYGNPSGQYPSWAFPFKIQEMQDEVDENDRKIREGALDAPILAELRAENKKLKERLDAIRESYPKSLDKDMVSRMCGEFGEKIAESMFTRADMQKGLADAHEECRRMLDPCIKLSPEMAGFAQMCKAKMTKDRMVSRNTAEKVWKIGRKFLGEDGNTERLRRD